MPEPLYPPAFEETLRVALSVPEPDPAFMTSLREQFLSRPIKETNMKPRSTRPLPRLAWGLALIVLLALVIAALSSPQVVNALKRLLGYVPGVGVVEQGNSLRVLAAPVTQTREGITLTVEQAVAAADNTFVVFHYVKDASFVEGPATPGLASGDPALRLPDGTEMKITLGHRLTADPQDPPGMALRYRMEFGPLPPGVEQVTVFMPQLIPLQPGAGPENWEVPLDLRVSTGLEGLPVTEIAPSPTSVPANTVAAPVTPTPDLGHGISFVLERVVPTSEGYILQGQTLWNITVPEDTGWYSISPASARLVDVNGQEVPYEEVAPDENPQPGIAPWSYKVVGKDLHWPIAITADTMWGDISFGSSVQSQAAFQFDPGPDPQVGQTWALDQNFKVDQYNLHLSSARLLVNPDSGNNYYEFTMDSPDGIVGAMLSDLDYPQEGGMGGGGVPDPGPFIARLNYNTPRPETGAPIRVAVLGLSFVFRGSWQATWSSGQ